MKQIKTFFLFLLCFNIPMLNAQVNISEHTQQIVEEMIKQGFIYEKEERSQLYKRFEKEVSQAELAILNNDKNAMIQCYTFDVLMDRENKDIFPVLMNKIYENSIVSYFYGCLYVGESVGSYCYNRYVASNRNSEKLEVQKIILDSIMIFDNKVKIPEKYDLLLKVNKNLNYYCRIREIAFSENNPKSILALSKFQNQDDIDIIIPLFGNQKTEYFAIQCAREFPIDLFYPYLIKIFERELYCPNLSNYDIWEVLFQALVRYPQSSTYQLFKTIVDIKDENRYQTLNTYLLIGLTKYPNELFNEIKKSIKLDKFHLLLIDTTK